MNKDIEFEKASKEAHYKWSSELAKRNLGQEISPAEISSLGRVPWEAAVSWAYEWCMRKNIIVRQMLITYGDVETLKIGRASCRERV